MPNLSKREIENPTFRHMRSIIPPACNIKAYLNSVVHQSSRKGEQKLLKQYKTEINPTREQIQKIKKTIGTCRYVYNFYLAHNRELYENGEKFMSGKSFSVWLNNVFLPNNPEYLWIKEVSSKAIKKSIENGYSAFLRFFKKQNGFPKFKKKDTSDVKMYFVKNNPKDCICERHRILIPTLGWVRIKEKGYIPTTKDGWIVKSGTVSIKAGRFYVSVLIDVPTQLDMIKNNDGIGIDLGIKDFAIISTGQTFKNINKTQRIRKLEKKLRREQRCFSRKLENIKKGKATQRKNIEKQKLKVQKINHTIENIRTDYINKTVAEIVKTKPSYIAIEELNVSGLIKNRHISHAISSQKLYEFRTKLKIKCEENGIELRPALPRNYTKALV